MRLSLLSVMITGSLLSFPVSHQATAAPVTSAVSRMTPAVTDGSVERVYYYQGHYYPYYYRGGYYPYRYHGAYYQHRYYRNGYWHYY